jgi:regulator of CtrA degradation
MVEISPAPTAFFSRTYDEAMQLLLEARDYIALVEPDDRKQLAIGDRLSLCCETMRLTARLTQVMAWLLTQKAVHAGELSLSEAASDGFALGGSSVCVTVTPGVEDVLPRRLLNLLDRSHRLYVRVSRLDDMVRREGSVRLHL